MRLTIVLLIVGLHIQARGLSQERVTLNVKDASLESVLKAISKQTGYQYALQDQWKGVAKKVNITVADAAVGDVLEELFKDQPFSYVIVGKIIVVKKKDEASNDINGDGYALNLPEITGVVQSENGEPLVGATIKVRGGKVVAVTDKEGNFVIHNVNNNAVLEISYTGYAPQNIHVSERQTHFSIVLKISNSKLDEVQVIAYGTTTQRYNLGSVSTVTAADIASQPISNPLQALEGRVPGLVVTQSSGLPGSSIQVQIRGQNTLNPNPSSIARFFPDNPLFIIDGVPFAPQNSPVNQFASPAAPSLYSGTNVYNNEYGGMSPFASINPADIESIEVLRDADATAIYGSRGANGVILITTKRGKAGKAKFNINIRTGESHVTRTPSMLNTQQYIAMRKEAIINDGDSLSDPYLYAPDITAFDTTHTTDWRKYFIGGSAHTTDVNTSLSGGTTTTQFLIGAGYHRETYIYPGNFAANSASMNVNLHHNSVDQRLFVDFSANYNYSSNNSPGSPSILTAFTLAPNYPNLFNSDGSINWFYQTYNLFDNPAAYLKTTYNSMNYNLLSHFQIGYQLLNGLTIRSSFGYNTFNGKEHSTLPSVALNPAEYSNTHLAASAGFGTNNFQTWIIEPQAEYKRGFLKGKLDVLVGGTFQQNTNGSTYLTGENYNNDALLGTIDAAGTITYVNDGYTRYKYSALFGRLFYSWGNRYLLNLTGRRDGSSRFGPGMQFGNFGSVATGWIFSEENGFKKAIPMISFGKLRASYGTTGNDNIGDYQYLPNWSPTRTAYQGQGAYNPVNLFQPNYSWAVNKKLETGLELGALKDRILVGAAWYRNRCGNQLISYPIPIQTGFSSVTENFQATVENSGWEFQISTVNIKSNQFSWTSSLNITFPKNKLVAFPGIENSSYAHTYIVGKSTNVLQTFKYIGLNDTTGVFQFATAKGTPTYSPTPFDDYSIIGNSDPKFYGGVRNSLNYKSFQIDIFLQFSKQMAANYLQQIYSNVPVGYLQTNQPSEVTSRWQKPGDRSEIERFTSNYGTLAANAVYPFLSSSGVYGDDFYIRVKTIALSYNVKSSYLKKIKMSACQIYLTAQNLFTLTDYKVGDPETQSIYTLPPLRTIVAGLHLTF